MKERQSFGSESLPIQNSVYDVIVLKYEVWCTYNIRLILYNTGLLYISFLDSVAGLLEAEQRAAIVNGNGPDSNPN